MAKRPTIHDIANEADVGVGTVSRVLNEHPSVSEATRRHVQSVIERLGYHPRTAAREIRGVRSNLVGLLADSVTTTPFAHALIKGAQDEARSRGRMLVLIDTDGNRDDRERAVASFRERSVEGVLYAAMFHHAVDLPAALYELPTVLVNCFDANATVASVIPDEEQGGHDATQHLLDAGHRRIGLITNDSVAGGDPAAVGRLAGYRRAHDEAGVPFDPELVREGDGHTEAGRRLAGDLLDRSDPPTAIFCATDRMAMGAYDAIKDRGLRIPQDVSVIGFDDQRYIADALSPALTTYALPHAAMGAWAVARLLDAANGAGPEPEQVRLRCPLVERDSVAAPPSPSPS